MSYLHYSLIILLKSPSLTNVLDLPQIYHFLSRLNKKLLKALYFFSDQLNITKAFKLSLVIIPFMMLSLTSSSCYILHYSTLVIRISIFFFKISLLHDIVIFHPCVSFLHFNASSSNSMRYALAIL